MKHRSLKHALIILTSLFVMSSSVWAQNQCGPEREVQAQALDEATYKQLSKFYEDIGEEKYVDAQNGLERMLGRSKDGSYAQAIILQALGFTSSSQEDYDKALEYFQRSVDLNALPNPQHYSMVLSISQLLIARERYREGLNSLAVWFCGTPPENHTSSSYVLKASAHVELEEYNPALASIVKAIELEDSPKENWYQLKLGIHYELDDLASAARTLEVMIAFWADKETYWKQLSSVYLNLKDENKALSVMSLAYRRDMLDTPQEILQLSSLYQFRDVPYEAAEVLEKGINDGIVESNKKYWEQTANAWYQARELEKSLAAYEKAGQFSSDGSIDLRRAFILVDRQDWDPAKDALERAIEKGGLSDNEVGNAYLLIGMAEMSQERFDAAGTAFNSALRYERSRSPARQWIEQLKQRREAS